MGSSFQKFFILYQKRHRQSKRDRQCLFILNFQICSFMVEKRYLSGSFPFLTKQKSQKALISLTFWLVRSRGWENRTPTKGFGDPYHTIWPIPYKVYFIYSQNYIHVDISLRINFLRADWVLYSSDSHFVTLSLSVICFANVQSVSGMLLHKQACSESFLLHPAASSASWSSPHPISNSQLHVLPHFHLCPIYLVVFKGVYFLTNGISHLKGGFTLRCLQRLSLPGLATRP